MKPTLMKVAARWCLFIAVSALSPVDAGALDQKTINERTRDLKMMSPVERDRLERNINEFQQLSSTEKEHFRSLHATLADDRVHNGGLTPLLQTYSAWLNSLSPELREEVRNEPDPAKKLMIVRRIKEESEHSKVSPEHHDEAIPSPPSLKFPAKGVLDAKDVAAVCRIIVERLPISRMKEFEQPQLENYIPLINASIQTSTSPKEWPDEVLMPKMIAAINSKDNREMIQKSASKRETLIRMLLLGILKQVGDPIRFPSEEEFLQTYNSLKPEERQQIMSNHVDVVRRKLTQRYFENKADDSIKRLGEYRRKLTDLFERLEVPLPPRLRKTRPTHDRG